MNAHINHYQLISGLHKVNISLAAFIPMDVNGTLKKSSSITQPVSERLRGDAPSDIKKPVRGGSSRRKARRPIKFEKSEKEGAPTPTTKGEETSTSPTHTRESSNDGGATTGDTQSEPTQVSTPISENGGGGGGFGEGSEWKVPITSPTKTVSVDNTITSSAASETNASIEANMHIAALSEWNPISENAPVNNNSTQPDESGYDSDASTIVWADPVLHNTTLDDFSNDLEIDEGEDEEFNESIQFNSTTENPLHPNNKPPLDDISTRLTKPVLNEPPSPKKIKLDGFDKCVSALPSIRSINPHVIKDRLIYFNIANSDPSIQKYAIPLRENGSTVYVGISAKSSPPKTYFTERSAQDQNMSVWFSSLSTLEIFYTVCNNIIESGDPYFSWKNQKVDTPNSEIDFSFKDGVLSMFMKNSISGKQNKLILLTLEMLHEFILNYWKLQDFVKFLKLRSDIIGYGETILLSVDKEISKQEFCELFLAGNQPNYVLNVAEIWKILESKYAL